MKKRTVDEFNAYELAARLVRNWYSLDPDVFEGVDVPRVVAEVGRAWETGGVEGVAGLTGIEVGEIPNLLWM
jgi:hypothetical protein